MNNINCPLIILSDCYRPSTATSNRLHAILSGFDSLGVDAEMIFIYENKEGDRIDENQFKHIRFHYLLEHNNQISNNRYIKLFQSFLYAKRYIKSLKKNTSVLLMDGIFYLPIILSNKKLKVFAERTEHPSMTVIPSIFNSYFMKKLEGTDGLFVISTALKEYYVNLGVSNIEIINMLVDETRFNGLQKNKCNEKYIAYCGSLANNKDGVDYLIRSFAIVNALHPEYKLYIIGPAHSSQEQNYNYELIKSFNLEKVVVLTGVVSRDKLPQLLLDAEVLVLARPDNIQAKYGFPTKLGEYLMTGNPVVVTRVGDIPLFLEDGKSALLADPADCQDIANKLNWAIEHPVGAAEIGKNGKKVALENFNNIKESRKMLNLINKV